jgi:hypothetical protein
MANSSMFVLSLSLSHPGGHYIEDLIAKELFDLLKHDKYMHGNATELRNQHYSEEV